MVLTTSMPVTIAREEAVEDGKNPRSNLAQAPYICYPINFGTKSILVLFDSGNKVNAIHLTFAKELDLFIRPIDVGVQKIDSTTLDIYGMVVVAFSVKNKANQVRFLEETFLVANVSPEIVLEMLFLILSGGNVDFSEYKFW